MDIFEFQAGILRAIQSVSNPAFDFLAKIITYFGSQYLIVLVILYILWCVDKKTGLLIGFTSCWTLAFSNGLKGLFKVKRPIGYEGIKTQAQETASGYSFPSGHAMNSASLMSELHLSYKKKIPLILAIVLPALVCLSRLYLGCHWPLDVICGYILGFFVPVIIYKVYEKFYNKKYLMYLISFILLVPYCFVKGDIADFWKAMGIFTGFIIGDYIEEKYINFSTDIPVRKKVIRVITGFIILLAIYLAMKLTFPETNIFNCIRYAVVALTGLVICPYVFVKFNI